MQYARKLIAFDQIRVFESGANFSNFTGKVVKEVKAGDSPGGDYDGVVVEVAGNAYFTGSSTFTLEEDDELKSGFLLR